MDLHFHCHLYFYVVSDWNENQWHRTLSLPQMVFADDECKQSHCSSSFSHNGLEAVSRAMRFCLQYTLLPQDATTSHKVGLYCVHCSNIFNLCIQFYLTLNLTPYVSSFLKWTRSNWSEFVQQYSSMCTTLKHISFSEDYCKWWNRNEGNDTSEWLSERLVLWRVCFSVGYSTADGCKAIMSLCSLRKQAISCLSSPTSVSAASCLTSHQSLRH